MNFEPTEEPESKPDLNIGTKDMRSGSWFALDETGLAIQVGHSSASHDTPYTFGRCRAYIHAQYTERGRAKLLVLKAIFGERGPMDSYAPSDD